MITVYTTETCQYCKVVCQFLKLKKQEFELVDVTNDLAKRNELHKATGYTTVPIIQKGDKYVVGYDAKKLMELINA